MYTHNDLIITFDKDPKTGKLLTKTCNVYLKEEDGKHILVSGISDILVQLDTSKLLSKILINFKESNDKTKIFKDILRKLGIPTY